MDRAVEMIFDVVADFVKYIFMLTILIVGLQYLNLYIAVDRILYEAELEGHFTEDAINIGLEKFNIDKKLITKKETDPDLGDYVNQLGDSMSIKLVKTIEIKTLGENFDFDITVVKKGINHGYYGNEGYGDYTLEE